MLSERLARQVERLLDDCDSAISSGDWERVRQAADAALRLDPANADAAAYLAAAARPPGLAPGATRRAIASRGAERRQMTVMFCDLVDSTPLAERLDPEDLRDILRAYQETCDEIVQKYDGFVAHYMGDGLLVYFGYPQAHEDDAARAILAGLEIVRAVPAVGASHQPAVPLQSRVGIHHGLVVVGQMGAGTRIEPSDVVGKTPNLAARLQSLALPGSVLISDELAQLVRGRFDLEDAGPRKLKGIADAVATWQALGERALDSESGPSALGPGLLVGRDTEWRALRECWLRSKEGSGHVVIIRGEPGIGKSRLVRELRADIPAGSGVAIELRCSALRQGSALHPVLDHLARRVLGSGEGDTDSDRMARIEAETARWHAVDGLAAQILASAFALPVSGEVASLAPQELKERTFELLASWVLQTASASPVLLIVEDIHWIDPSSLELLLLLAERSQRHRLMICATARPEFRLVLLDRPGVVEIELSRLCPEDANRLAASLAGERDLPAHVRGQVVARSDGIPLFIEELLRAVGGDEAVPRQRRPDGLANAVDVPASLHDSLMARLDRMTSARRVAQVASALGRQFSFDMLNSLGELNDQSLKGDLGRLTEAGILVLHGSRGRLEYAFKHALIQDVAYQSLLRSERARLHGRIAQAYERDFPKLAEREPEVVAYHLTEAHQTERAIGYLVRAGAAAVARSANVEAVQHLDHALALLEGVPVGPGRTRQELDIRLQAGRP
jgi:class 3 adenylate cyclase